MLFIFDWDGTLSDSTGRITQAMQQGAESLGWSVPADDHVRNIIGLGLPEAIARLFPDTNDADRQQLKEAYRRYYLTLEEHQPSPFFPTVLDTLAYLRERGHQLTIATSKSRQGLERILQSLEMEYFFHGSRCADETASKPHPLMLQELLIQFAVPAADAVMIGDTEYDMEMAQRIRMPRIAVSYGAHVRERLTAFDPELCLDQFDQLLDWPRLTKVGG